MSNSPKAPPNARTQAILTGTPLKVLVMLAAPSSTAFLIQALVSMSEVYFVAQLGTTALAAMAIVFPLLMLLQMMSAGALGGAVSSAIARALGNGNQSRAESLLWHAFAIAAVGALLFGLLFATFGAQLLHALGGRGEIFDAAYGYCVIVFVGALFLWWNNTAAAIFRGIGNTRFPAMIMIASAFVQVPLSGALILGWGPLPRLGLTGAALSTIAVALVSLLVMQIRLIGGAESVRLTRRALALRAEEFTDILRVALLAGLSPIFTVLTIISLTGLVGRFGEEALAGYGIGSRLEFLLIPLVFGIGSAMTTMVGLQIGAGNIAAAERIGRVGGTLAAALTGVVGLLLALFPGLWVSVFTSDPATATSAESYLRIVGPAYLFQGVGLSLYFASQGAGRVLWPVIAVIARFVVAVGGGAVAVILLPGELNDIYVAASIAMVLFGTITVIAVARGAWRAKH